MENSLFLLAFFSVLVICTHSLSPSPTQLQDVCNLQLQNWTQNANLSFSSPSPSLNLTHPIFSGAYIRGKWQENAVGPSSSSSTGGFEFITRDGLDHSTNIVNISGSIYLMHLHSSIASLQATGFLNSASGDICMACCKSILPAQNSKNKSEPSSDCEIRATFTLKYSIFRLLSTQVNGQIESLRPPNDPLYFSNLTITGDMVKQRDQHVLFVSLLWFRFCLTLVEVLFVVIQIYHSTRKQDAYYVSTLGLLVQLLVFGFNWVRSIYLPFMYLKKLNFRHFMRAWSWTLPIVSDFLVIVGYLVLIGIIWNKKRKGKRVEKGELKEARELPMLLLGLPLYMVVGLILWWMKSFETYLRVLLYFWLLPQVVANVIWDMRHKPLSLVFMFGTSICRIITLVYNTYRPTLYGYDDVYIFPKSWFWCMLLSLLTFLTLAVTQQVYGGRWFVPKRVYGYQQLELSNHASSSTKDQLYT